MATFLISFITRAVGWNTSVCGSNGKLSFLLGIVKGATFGTSIGMGIIGFLALLDWNGMAVIRVAISYQDYGVLTSYDCSDILAPEIGELLNTSLLPPVCPVGGHH